MTIRAGMSNLVNRVRALTGAGTADYTAGSITYWTDNHLQDALDRHARFVVSSPLTWIPETIPGGTAVWWNGQLAYRDIEESPGTVDGSRFILRDGTGAAIGTANYTLDAQAGRVSFGTINQGGTAYYATLYTYDVCAAAVDILRERLSSVNSWFDFSADNQSFSRSQVRTNIREMMTDLRGCIGGNVVGKVSGDVHTSEFVRTDLNPRGWGGWHND